MTNIEKEERNTKRELRITKCEIRNAKYEIDKLLTLLQTSNQKPLQY